MNEWLTPVVRALLALVLVVAAQAAAPATVRGLCGVLPVVVQPVEAGPRDSRSSELNWSVPAKAWLAPSWDRNLLALRAKRNSEVTAYGRGR